MSFGVISLILSRRGNLYMKRVSLLYDATIVCNILTRDSSRSGIFFVAYNILLEFLKRPEYEVYLYADDLIRLREVVNTFPEFANCKIYKFSFLHEWVAYCRNRKNENKRNHGSSIVRGVFGLTASILKKFYWISQKSSKMEDIDAYFSPMKAIPSHIKKNKHIKCYTVLHDVTPLTKECKGLDIPSKWFHKLIKTIDGNDFFFANSEYTKQDFIKYVPSLKADNITVIPLSTGKPYRKIDDEFEINRVKQKYNIPIGKKYIFSLCSLNPRKNLIFAIKNFLKFVEKNNLDDFIFVLGGAYFDGFMEILNKHLEDFGDITDKILRVGYVEDEDLSALYSGAEMFLFPSLYEGFGMPILEAMQCGLPVICSNCTSIPEVIGDCGIQIDPHSDDDMLSAIEKMYFDKEFRNSCVQKGLERAKMFTWSKCGDIITDRMCGKHENKKQDFINYANVQ
jgi:glycosyltransferase involved in cell wall biosynthesis